MDEHELKNGEVEYMSDLFKSALKQGSAGQRLIRQEAFALAQEITPDRLHEIGRAAFANRSKRFDDRATYVFNIQINPANICWAGCSFCDYAASSKDTHAYVLSEDDILSRVEAVQPTEAHIVGGLNRVWPYERNLELVRELRRRYRRLHIKAFTAVEIAYFAKTSKKSEELVLQELKDAGVNALPGGGAEIFSDRLYRQHWKNKIGPDQWVRIHQLAHDQGLFTNATMLFGFGDTWQERIRHMLILRQAQDKSGGFSCFIPLPFQPGKDKFISHGPTPLETLAVMGIARLVVDNIDHIKSYWPMTGVETAAAGLSWGADDMDGTIVEEKIAHMAGAVTPKGLARDSMRQTIQIAGFKPIERDGKFNPVSVD
ncbi:MAG: CofH family radical SAM protein [Desulfobacteraceae bacterium]|nr:CofH family radical SAM protein [Desulfobacteraceae bacterium]